MTLRHTQVFLSLPPSISSCPSVSPHFLDALYSGSETLFPHCITVLNILNLKYTKKKAYVFSWVTELLVLFFYHIDKNVHIICTHYAKRHETNDKRWIRDVIWSWHKILKRQENDNTKRKTLYDLKLFKKFLTSGNERREIPAADLQHLVRDKVCAQSEK